MYNWNKIFIGYCDGGSFSGRKKDPYVFSKNGVKRNLYFKGHFILNAVYDMFLSDHNMNRASDVVISGSSAGGLAVILNLDFLANKIKARSSASPVVVGVSDGGFFMDLPSIKG